MIMNTTTIVGSCGFVEYINIKIKHQAPSTITVLGCILYHFSNFASVNLHAFYANSHKITIDSDGRAATINDSY